LQKVPLSKTGQSGSKYLSKLQKIALKIFFKTRKSSKKKNILVEPKPNFMAFTWIVGFLVLSLPLAAGAALIYFMMAGKGKPAATQDMIEEVKRTRTAAKN
jgi:hypothetical protein